MVLGESRVSLDKDVVKEKPLAVSPTFMEWAADGNVEQIIAAGNEGASLIFTVPNNKTLFITSAWVGGMETANVNSHGHIILFIEDPAASGTLPILGASVDHVTGQHGGNTNNSLSFPMPLRVEQKNKIAITSPNINTPRMRGGFQGFLLDKKISIR